MALPKIDVPIYTLELPLSKKKVRYRSFLVKEEKILLMAMESEDEKTVMESIKQIVNNCVLDELDVDTLPLTDLEFIFLNLRARSVGEIVNLQYKCNNKVKDAEGEEKVCNNVVQIDVNLLEIKPEINKKHNKKIELSKELGIVMRYPDFKIMESIDGATDTEKIMKIVSSCIDYIYDKETIYYRKDIEEKELVEFVDSMSREQFLKVQEFFDTLPKIKKEVDFKCNKCGHEENIVIEGLQNFFV
jgi:DNA-directed RNA polymerase subunit M/transcription elongation factor TFIIS